jgi:hypothetical protein
LRRQLSWHCFAHGWQRDEGFDQAAYCPFSFLSIVEAKNCTFSDMHVSADVPECNYVKKVWGKKMAHSQTKLGASRIDLN